ncbi:MAG: phosphatidylglycerophosphatase A [Mailhella sp.]|nr:phosphatidylglycerophosphatase A [Mailhella sp.]
MTFSDACVLHFCRLGPAGLSPKAPGTAGSLLSVLAAPFLFLPLPLTWRMLVLAVLFVAGGFAATRAERILGEKDPGCVVIDELVGQWTAMLFLGSFSAGWSWADAVFLLLPFALFRFFDILKPRPIHASEDWLPAGWGIMLDDVIGGVYALVCMCAAAIAMQAFFPGAVGILP